MKAEKGIRRPAMLLLTCGFLFPSFGVSLQRGKPTEPERIVGTLSHVVAVGGETTGWRLRLDQERMIGKLRLNAIEVDPGPKKLVLDDFQGKRVEVVGTLISRRGVEKRDRPVLVIDTIRDLPPAKAVSAPPGTDPKIVDVLFEDYSGGLSPRWQMRAGEDLVLSFRIEGFGRLEQLNKEGLREHRVSLHYQLELRDPAGVLVTPGGSDDIETTLTLQDSEWRPKINWTAAIPPSAPSGEYTIRIQASDRIAKKNFSKNVSFRVVGAAVPPSTDLQIVQLEYSNSERGPWNPQRYFSPADTVWVRYKVVGFRVSRDNEVSVEQDWAVRDEEGKVIVAQPSATLDHEKSFYPPRFLSTVFTLNLTDAKPGKYTLQIDLRDAIGQQTASFESDFVLRP